MPLLLPNYYSAPSFASVSDFEARKIPQPNGSDEMVVLKEEVEQKTRRKNTDMTRQHRGKEQMNSSEMILSHGSRA